MIHLEPINQDNYRACLKLKVHPEQENLVANNFISIAQAYVFPSLVPQAILDDETVVGFVMHEKPHEEPEYWVHRLMIGNEFQGKGYGRAAMKALISQLTAAEDYTGLKISFVPANTAAEALYASLDFVRTGEIIEEEVVMAYQG